MKEALINAAYGLLEFGALVLIFIMGYVAGRRKNKKDLPKH